MGGFEAQLRLQYAKENLTELLYGRILVEVKVFGQFLDVYQSLLSFNHEHFYDQWGFLKRDIFFSEEIQN